MPQVPLADRGGRVAEGLQPVGDRRFFSGQPGRVGAAVELVAEARLIAAGHQAGPRRAAVGRRDVALREAHAVLGDRVDVRRRDVLAPLATQFAPAEIVGVQNDEVRLVGRLRLRARQSPPTMRTKKRNNAENFMTRSRERFGSTIA